MDYFLNAREDQILEHYNLSAFEQLQTSGKSWVITGSQISYIKPAATLETVVIDSQLIQYADKALLVEMKMWDREEKELKAILWARFVHYDIRMKSASSHSEALTELFKAVVVPCEQTFFEERCAAILQELKTIKR